MNTDLAIAEAVVVEAECAPLPEPSRSPCGIHLFAEITSTCDFCEAHLAELHGELARVREFRALEAARAAKTAAQHKVALARAADARQDADRAALTARTRMRPWNAKQRLKGKKRLPLANAG